MSTIDDRLAATILLTAEEECFQFLEQLSTSIQLLLETLGHEVIHVARLQQLLERLNHGAHVPATNDADATAIFDLLSLKGELPGLGLN